MRLACKYCTYVTPEAPPFLLVRGDRDESVPLNQSQLLAAALERVGVEVMLHVVRGAGHGQFHDPAVMRLVEAFFDRHLRRD